MKRNHGGRDADTADAGNTVTPDGPVRRNLLCQMYPTVLTLRDYVLLKLPSNSRLRRKKVSRLGKCQTPSEIEARVSTFLDSTLVCLSGAISETDSAPYEQWLSFSQTGDESHVTLSSGISDSESIQSELVDFVIWLLFKRETRTGAWPKHLLCDGFRKRTKEGDPSGTSIPGIYSLHPNHHASALKQEPWPHILALLGRSGQEIMLDLLLRCSIFVVVNAGVGNYYQLNGFPLSELDVTGPSRAATNNPRKLSDIAFVRSRIFYAKPALTARGRVQPGYKHIRTVLIFLSSRELRLQKQDVLNRCPYLKDGENEADAEKNAAHTTKVLMYIFPKQFGLHNVFTSNVNVLETSQKFQDYTMREEEIANMMQGFKPRSDDTKFYIPKRLRGTPRNLVQRLQILHARCSYVELLNHYCPSPFYNKRPRKQPSQTEGKSQTLVREGPQEDSPDASDATNDRKSEKTYSTRPESFGTNTLVDLATSTCQVSAFCQAVLCNIVPNEFWGQDETMRHNKTAILHMVNHFVKLRRFESMTLHEVTQGLKVANILWLQPPSLAGEKTSQTDMSKRSELFHEFLYYLFDSLLIPLIRATFYVTESSTHRYKVFYFRHDVWRSITEPALSQLKSEMFEEIKPTEANDILDSRRLGFSQMRLLPKGNKLRPIMNLRRRQVRRTNGTLLGPSINSVLGPVHTVLKFEKIAKPQRLGATLFSVSDMYTRLKGFRQSFDLSKSHCFFFAKVDVQSAFDTIPQDAVIQLIRSVPSQRQYTITKHAEVQPGERSNMAKLPIPASRPMRRWHASALPSGQQLAFIERLHNGLGNIRKNTVFVDGVAQKRHDANALLDLLSDHIQRNLVKVGKRYYRQKRGIPQGSVLSSFLCNYFYADLEEKQLSFLQTPDCLLMRLIDDFLLISLDKAKAVKFVEVMHRGVPEYGVQVSRKKTLVNFDMQLGGEAVCKSASGDGFPYCGTKINDKTLAIIKDSKGSGSTATSHSLTVEYSRFPGQNFERKILNAFKIQSHLMFFDTSHNSPQTVLDSLDRAFSDTARKMWAYIRCLSKAQRPSSSLITRTISKVAEVAFSILSSKSRRLRYPQYACSIRRGQVTRAAYGAFLKVLDKKQTNYVAVIAWLRNQDTRLSSL